ncbi:MAG: 50S ribosomal protein L32 [Clostridia bacterium]|nr:50S ribosomal protein L32 [Clostridia bacterium]MBT7122690.1 50S ribosomal protein L32 [Clostridia bacterium]
MAVPKRRSSRQRRNKRKSANWKIAAPTMMECPQCHTMKLAHRLCGTCGYYNGRQVIDTEKPAKAE